MTGRSIKSPYSIPVQKCKSTTEIQAGSHSWTWVVTFSLSEERLEDKAEIATQGNTPPRITQAPGQTMEIKEH